MDRRAFKFQVALEAGKNLGCHKFRGLLAAVIKIKPEVDDRRLVRNGQRRRIFGDGFVQ